MKIDFKICIFVKKNEMKALVITAQTQSNFDFLVQLANKIGEKSYEIDNNEIIEDFLLGKMMEKAKTSENVNREVIMKKLSGK